MSSPLLLSPPICICHLTKVQTHTLGSHPLLASFWWSLVGLAGFAALAWVVSVLCDFPDHMLDDTEQAWYLPDCAVHAPHISCMSRECDLCLIANGTFVLAGCLDLSVMLHSPLFDGLTCATGTFAGRRCSLGSNSWILNSYSLWSIPSKLALVNKVW